MPINPIKEQRKIAKKYIIGYYSLNDEFGEKLENTLNSTELKFINLKNIDTETLKLYLSTLDEGIFDTKIPKNFSEILKDLKLFVRIIGLKDIENLPNLIQDRSKLVLELKHEKNFELEKDLKFIMQIVSILENKDPYTKDHSARVSKYSIAIGEEFFDKKFDELYGNSDKNSEELKHNYIIQNLNMTMLAAWAHDIGKNSIAQNLLNKNSKLTKDEYDIMKLHADFGADIIRKILGDEELAEIIENHHERIDGNGYHKLENFSDISKIIAIADSFDAMTTTRNYTTKNETDTDKHQLKTVEDAINELQISSHVHFDINENKVSQQLDTSLTQIFVNILKKDLNLIKAEKLDEVTLLSGGLDDNGFLKAGFWNDQTQEYSKDSSVSNNLPKLFQ